MLSVSMIILSMRSFSMTCKRISGVCEALAKS